MGSFAVRIRDEGTEGDGWRVECDVLPQGVRPSSCPEPDGPPGLPLSAWGVPWKASFRKILRPDRPRIRDDLHRAEFGHGAARKRMADGQRSEASSTTIPRRPCAFQPGRRGMARLDSQSGRGGSAPAEKDGWRSSRGDRRLQDGMRPVRGTPIGLESKIVRRHPRAADMAGSCRPTPCSPPPLMKRSTCAYWGLPARTVGPCAEAVPISVRDDGRRRNGVLWG